ncbi:alpha/beta hydrolase [Neobacillus sp. PS2-9]|uniref:alpha/beta hydrolase n=1 Tax=Neobacillus sp. PS2-9 TaxID=3070676 RepID=UPI0027DF04F2|nr:alpha/beta hydrolase [Neobacillus sp. PS2-9]WML56136.1 alpha/beta hydrolase [Neobacillus sp. PS2-9]
MVVFYIVSAIGLCLILGILYQWLATKFDERQYPAPGKFVEIDGRRLHYQSFGVEKGPIVIFDHGCGIGSSSLIWKLVADKVSQFARVISYDRAGYGWSDSGSYPRTNEAAVEDLRILIEKVNMIGPIVLVGHSYGGLNVRLFAKEYPNLVAGIVLVDATHEDERTSRFPAKYVEGQMMGRKAFKMLKYLCYFGILRILGKLHVFSQIEEILKKFPKKQLPIYQSTLFLNKTAKAVASEFSHLDAGYNAVRGSSLGHVPLVVIKSEIVENLNGFSEIEVVETKKSLHEVAVEMSKLSTNGELWVAGNSGHNIHVEDPDLVVKAIDKVCQNKVGAFPYVR